MATNHVRPSDRREIVWRFPDSNARSPAPVEITGANFAVKVSDAALKQPPSALVGKMSLKVQQQMGKDEQGADAPFNRIEIEITEAESLQLNLYDGFVNLGLPVTVVVNGETIHDKVKVERDWDFLVKNILPRSYFMLPVTATLDCTFPHKPQFVPPAEEPKEGAEAGKETGEDAPTADSVQTGPK